MAGKTASDLRKRVVGPVGLEPTTGGLKVDPAGAAPRGCENLGARLLHGWLLRIAVVFGSSVPLLRPRAAPRGGGERDLRFRSPTGTRLLAGSPFAATVFELIYTSLRWLLLLLWARLGYLRPGTLPRPDLVRSSTLTSWVLSRGILRRRPCVRSWTKQFTSWTSTTNGTGARRSGNTWYASMTGTRARSPRFWACMGAWAASAIWSFIPSTDTGLLPRRWARSTTACRPCAPRSGPSRCRCGLARPQESPDPLAEQDSAPEWPGQGWPEAIAQRRAAPLTRPGGVRTVERRVGGS